MRKLWTLSISFHPLYPLCQQSSLLIHFHSIYSILCEWETFQLDKGKDRCWRHYCIWKSFNKGPLILVCTFFFYPCHNTLLCLSVAIHIDCQGKRARLKFDIWRLVKEEFCLTKVRPAMISPSSRLYRFARSHRQQLSSSGVNEYGYSVSGYKERSMALAAQIQKWT